METYLRSRITDALLNVGVDKNDIPEIKIETPREASHGDAATNVAMMLASVLKRNPRQIAQDIIDQIDLDPQRVTEAEVAGPGFINFRYSENYLYDEFQSLLDSGTSYGRTNDFDGQRVLVEFVSANPTGPLTVGHGRNAVLGDTVARLLEWSGAEVDREYYFNNAGRQMRILGKSVQARYHQLFDQPFEFPDGGYEGGYIQDIAQQLADESGDSLLNESDESVFRKKAEQTIFEHIVQTLERMNIKMDSFFNEHTLYEDGFIDKTIQGIREKGFIYDKDGAVWFKTTEFGKEQDTVLIKSSGEPTYRLPDIAYHVTKLERGYDLCLDVFGADHIDTYPDVVKGVEVLGYDTSKIDVLVYQFVTLVKDGKPFKMSTRQANFVTLDELMDEVGEDVTRFFFLMRSPNTHLEFDISRAKEAGEKNPVFYLQYAHARIQSILRKVAEVASEEYRLPGEKPLHLLKHEAEIALIKKLLAFPGAITTAAVSREPHKLITYLNELASSFTSFYHDCRILGESPDLMLVRSTLAHTTATVLANGLTILGIDAPDRM